MRPILDWNVSSTVLQIAKMASVTAMKLIVILVMKIIGAIHVYRDAVAAKEIRATSAQAHAQKNVTMVSIQPVVLSLVDMPGVKRVIVRLGSVQCARQNYGEPLVGRTVVETAFRMYETVTSTVTEIQRHAIWMLVFRDTIVATVLGNATTTVDWTHSAPSPAILIQAHALSWNAKQHGTDCNVI